MGPFVQYHALQVTEKAHRRFTFKKEAIVQVSGGEVAEQHWRYIERFMNMKKIDSRPHRFLLCERDDEVSIIPSTSHLRPHSRASYSKDSFFREKSMS